MTRGRGRPARFDQTMQTALLAAIADGLYLKHAAAHVGIHPNVPTRHARTDPDFAAQLADARAEGKKRRDDTKPHGEGHYNNQACRHPECRTAATRARTTRRREAAAAEPEPDAPIINISRESPPCPLLLARAS